MFFVASINYDPTKNKKQKKTPKNKNKKQANKQKLRHKKQQQTNKKTKGFLELYGVGIKIRRFKAKMLFPTCGQSGWGWGDIKYKKNEMNTQRRSLREFKGSYQLNANQKHTTRQIKHSQCLNVCKATGYTCYLHRQ